MRALWKVIRDEEAATAVEYAVMLAMILLCIISAIGMVGGETFALWGTINGDLEAHGF
ncbi:MAG: Flp family type IVb pilin [Pirellulales bacterium]|nr:Flp family type IVb pilin [Pirellulales bacterium]